MSFFHTTEFYIILFLVAVAIVAFIAKPASPVEAMEYLLGGVLSAEGGDDGAPGISVDCDDSGCVWLRRTGITGVDITGAVSAKVVVKGTNITVYERITPGRYGDDPVDTVLFSLDMLHGDRYWLRYESESTNRTATLSFRNTPGYHAQSLLKQ